MNVGDRVVLPEYVKELGGEYLKCDNCHLYDDVLFDTHVLEYEPQSNITKRLTIQHWCRECIKRK